MEVGRCWRCGAMVIAAARLPTTPTTPLAWESSHLRARDDARMTSIPSILPLSPSEQSDVVELTRDIGDPSTRKSLEQIYALNQSHKKRLRRSRAAQLGAQGDASAGQSASSTLIASNSES